MIDLIFQHDNGWLIPLTVFLMVLLWKLADILNAIANLLGKQPPPARPGDGCHGD